MIHEAIGIRYGSITTTTGSTTAITLIYLELKGQLNGLAVRVPLRNAAITDCVFEVELATDAEEVNALFKVAAEGSLKRILRYEVRPLVSADNTNDTRSSIVNARHDDGGERHAGKGLCLVPQ
ncbi:Glyceraldehyde-3-phosphate dehydrogenase 3 [Defluviimonas aquaemixtae]|uniref:Glyceraldehyde-3-phosphate dehydrogenase 3 n=1 Tax=Albidovulum aquaemixtae TaxID=1542388 RepID=A0A2R8BMP7_9RHOB|nr:Glyceraldehyde-3-phosphate dehydrogenase 3 [Defluviimonas aquaemixtae]